MSKECTRAHPHELMDCCCEHKTVSARLQSELAAAREENANLKTVMIAAAEEISAHWEAHCDAEGYGPVNLLRRLEKGIPSEYGYTAGAFARQKAELDRAKAELERARELLGNAGECRRVKKCFGRWLSRRGSACLGGDV